MGSRQWSFPFAWSRIDCFNTALTLDQQFGRYYMFWNFISRLLPKYSRITEPRRMLQWGLFWRRNAFWIEVTVIRFFQTFRSSIIKAQLDIEGGVSPRLSPMMTMADAGNLLSKSGFADVTVDSENITIQYPNVQSLLHDLQLMGESNAIFER